MFTCIIKQVKYNIWLKLYFLDKSWKYSFAYTTTYRCTGTTAGRVPMWLVVCYVQEAAVYRLLYMLHVHSVGSVSSTKLIKTHGVSNFKMLFCKLISVVTQQQLQYSD
jgi:hypothetical protein